MALATGTKLGPYEILAPIGSGGIESQLSRSRTRKDIPASMESWSVSETSGRNPR